MAQKQKIDYDRALAAAEFRRLMGMDDGGVEKQLEKMAKEEKEARDEAVGVEKKSVQKKKVGNLSGATVTGIDTTSYIKKCKWAELGKSEPIKVTFAAHDILYKNQRWPIGERTVEYQVQLVETTGRAARLAEDIHARRDMDGKMIKTEEALNRLKVFREKAISGDVRYYTIVTYESIPNDCATLGTVEVLSDGTINIRIDRKFVESKHINYTMLKKRVDKAMNSLVRYNV